MGKSTMYAVYLKDSDRPFRHRIINNQGESTYLPVNSMLLRDVDGYQSCFNYGIYSKEERIQARKLFNKEQRYIEVKLFTFEE